MGNSATRKPPTTAQQELTNARERAAKDIGELSVSLRYHSPPEAIDADYEYLTETLGHGFNGAVVLGRRKDTGELCAIKPFKLLGLPKVEKNILRNEIQTFLVMDHPHVAQLKDVYEDEYELQLVMEKLEGGELLERIHQKERFTERDAVAAMVQMLRAVSYLHGKGIVHRDIKCENFLYESRTGDHLKMIDFGFSRHHSSESKKMKLSCGSLAYKAPEVISQSYTNKCDMWSLGVVAFVMLTGRMPFDGLTEWTMTAQIQKGANALDPGVWSSMSANAKSFILSLMELDPDTRLSAGDALNHPWIVECSEASDDHVVDKAALDSMVMFAQASKFKRTCLSMMALNMTLENRAKIRDIFLSLDTSNSGTITIAELKQALSSQGFGDDENTKTMFAALDTNNTERVDYSNFLAAMMASYVKAHEQVIRGTFNRLDADGSGVITEENLRQVLGDCLSDEEVQAFMKEADISNTGVIELEDFIAYLSLSDCEEKHLEAAQRVIQSEVRKSTAPTSKALPPAVASSTALQSTDAGGTSEPAPVDAGAAAPAAAPQGTSPSAEAPLQEQQAPPEAQLTQANLEPSKAASAPKSRSCVLL